MTFSEYVKTKALGEYLEYCKLNGLVPEIDLKVESKKLCALVLPKNDKQISSK